MVLGGSSFALILSVRLVPHAEWVLLTPASGCPGARVGLRLLCPPARRPAPPRRGLWPSRLWPPGPAPSWAPFCAWLRASLFFAPAPSTPSVPGTRGSLLFPEGRRDLDRIWPAPCHISRAYWELPPRPKATSREWVGSAKKEFAVLQDVGRWGTRRKLTRCHYFKNVLLIRKERHTFLCSADYSH